MIDVTALRSLCAVATTGTIARAAADLGFTPSAVSQQVKRLEHQVGVALVAPAGRGVVLTPAGRSLVESSPEIFDALERGAHAARSIARGTPAGVIRIVGFSTAIRGLLAPCLPALALRYPDLCPTIVEQDPDEAVQTVAAGAADLALVHDVDGMAPHVPTSLTERAIHTDVGDLAVHRAHPLATRDSVSSADLDGCAWATSPAGTACHQWFQRLLADRTGQPDVRHRVDDFSTQLALVAGGEVVALVPRLARPAVPDGVVLVPVLPSPTRHVAAVWRRSADESPAIRVVVEALTDPTTVPLDDPRDDGPTS